MAKRKTNTQSTELTLPSGSELIRHQPELMLREQAAAEAIINYKIKIQDWPEAEAAIRLKINQQRGFVEWWQENVTVRHGGVRTKYQDPDTWSFAKAEEATGIQQEQVSRWRQSLADPERYYERQFLSACRKAGIEPPANFRAEGTGENEWFTPVEYVEAARVVLGEIDLDPASNSIAQEWIKATEYFTKAVDGLSHEWHGRVWLNPPYAREDIPAFINKLLREIEAARVSAAILLTHSYTDTEWFHNALSAMDAVCFTRGRIKFVDDRGQPCAPTQGQAFFYYGGRVAEFTKVFKKFGFIAQPRGVRR